MQIPGQIHLDGPADDAFRKEPECGVGIFRIAGIGLLHDPLRKRNAENHACIGRQIARDFLEVAHLRLIEIGAELQVDCKQPPVRWQFQCVVAASLSRGAAGEAAVGSAEDAREGNEPVIPVVIARQREHIGALRLTAESDCVRRLCLALVVITCRIRIDLIAAKQQQAAPRQALHAAVARRELERWLSNLMSDSVGRVPAVTNVADVVEPEITLGL